MSYEATEPHAVDCVRVHLNSCGLSEVLFKGSSEPASQALIDEMEVVRSGGSSSERKSEVFRISRAARSRILCKGSKVQHELAIVCSERSSVVKLTARVLHRHCQTDSVTLSQRLEAE